MNLPESCKQCQFYEFIDCCYCSMNPNHDDPGMIDIKDRFTLKGTFRIDEGYAKYEEEIDRERLF